ncbi:hypothetical protein GCM10010359_04800 [Streptomyces morookaense]|nr:hypothetical protein GCM10010359_04800 [Streptomyces morookaense]
MRRSRDGLRRKRHQVGPGPPAGDAGRDGPDQYIPGARFGLGSIDDVEDAGGAEAIDLYGARTKVPSHDWS